MDTNTLLLIALAVIVVIVAVAAIIAGNRKRRSEELHDRFGPVYDHTVQEFGGDKERAEQELAAREKRVEAFDIHPLNPKERDRFQEQWRSTQAEFVDAPDRAIADADRLIQQVMQAEGYPVGDFDQRAADISVDHPNVVMHYRAAHDLALKNEKGKATTEDLRQAMVHYRALFENLLQVNEAEQDQDDKNKQELRRAA